MSINIEKKPLICILGEKQYSPSWKLEEQIVGDDYLQSIIEAGGIPIMLPYTTKNKVINEYVNLCDGFLIPGGIDVDPYCYKEDKEECCEKTDIDYDIFQLKVIEKVLRKRKPLYGICRGLQIINVAFGGKLYQDLSMANKDKELHKQTLDRTLSNHFVETIEKSSARHLFGKNIGVNSMHHQAIKELGKGLIASAYSEDGLIEAIEMDEYPLLAVQWHPENFIRARKNDMKKFFESLIKMAEISKEERR